jgi:hypothetical protein
VTDIDRYQWRLTLQLLLWGTVSLLSGTVILTGSEEPFLRGLAVQLIAWGAIDAILAATGAWKAWSGARSAPDEYGQVRKTVRLRRLLRINARLDVLYCLVGAGLIVFASTALARGHGAGVLLQGFFLFLFDGFHARRLPSETPAWYDPAV